MSGCQRVTVHWHPETYNVKPESSWNQIDQVGLLEIDIGVTGKVKFEKFKPLNGCEDGEFWIGFSALI